MVLCSLTAFPLLLVLVRLSGGYATLVTPGWRRMVARGFMMFLTDTAVYLAPAALPLATTGAFCFSAPLFVTVFSVLLPNEPIGPRRWAAVAVGFGGVLVMVRPGTDLFDWAALLALFSGLSDALSMIAARYLGPTETAAALAFWGTVVFLGCAVLMAVLFGHGAIAAAGLTLLTQAYRVSASAIVAPFEYTAMLRGVVWGWLFWRDWPDAAGWSGFVVIVGAGLYVLYREAPTAPPRT